MSIPHVHKENSYVLTMGETTLNLDEDMVNSPPHYDQSIECIDAMKAMTEGKELPPHQAYCWQNAFKYLWRWPRKKKVGLEDLKKCRWYLDRLIAEVEAEK